MTVNGFALACSLIIVTIMAVAGVTLMAIAGHWRPAAIIGTLGIAWAISTWIVFRAGHDWMSPAIIGGACVLFLAMSTLMMVGR